MNSDKPLLLIGGGGHASVLADILLSQGRDILAVISPDDISARKVFQGIPHITHDDEVKNFSPKSVLLVNGIGMMPRSTFRRLINQHFLDLGYQFETVIANNAFVSNYSEIKPGAQILPGAIVHTGAIIGEHSIINSNVLIEHDCKIGCYNHIAPKATLCGEVRTGKDVYVGANSTVVQGLVLAEQSVVGAGAVLTQVLPARSTCYPARSMIKANRIKGIS
ncbi:acetyltransferase [Shewanella salipaludis]|uniref:Acetyltransferase n=1 Tax=Shewanella salipaludis TaxID=2723052 RepID=A0A972G6V7_9GAMM|nr:acetyltransferase [Shewanella salipaludis]NMH65595.1 acetyltransferase [Shewanella salipaludis]